MRLILSTYTNINTDSNNNADTKTSTTTYQIDNKMLLSSK